MAESADVIVVGLGGMGSAAAYHVAQRGRHVIGFDSYPRNHANGSSHGRSRMIREILGFDGYIPLMRRAYELWRQLEELSGQTLLRANGLLSITPPDSATMAMWEKNARRFGFPHEKLSSAQVNERFPGFALGEDLVALYEPRAGMLPPEACVAAHLDAAAAHGADLRHSEHVLAWHADRNGVRVETANGSFSAKHLVVTAGPWAPEILAALNLPLTPVRVVNIHFQPTRPELFHPDAFPTYSLNVPEGYFYGCPDVDDDYGTKIGEDSTESCTPATIRRDVDASETAAFRRVLDRYLPAASGPISHMLTCMYTMTPDHNFVIDTHPEHSNVAIACGCSGHAFKFTPVIGEILADLAVDGRTNHDISHLSASRFSS